VNAAGSESGGACCRKLALVFVRCGARRLVHGRPYEGFVAVAAGPAGRVHAACRAAGRRSEKGELARCNVEQSGPGARCDQRHHFLPGLRIFFFCISFFLAFENIQDQRRLFHTLSPPVAGRCGVAALPGYGVGSTIRMCIR
jgi:hypothetical protein